MKKVIICIIRFYQYVISPSLGSSCIFTPSCSAYAILTIQRHHLIKALVLIVFRLLKCHPWQFGKCNHEISCVSPDSLVIERPKDCLKQGHSIEQYSKFN
ncbi:membrane protein insertion efficiency factor YidD [Candidatus Sarmatiella mevalonica]|uniref:membrane protein insertion efficiency factor YidD n=1 Tax=Candidatus Sarmatiella mevalonica TaxID=2770581 RepID=UPI0019215CF8|nr:membrane protein insertion efficiency factor YidD [Candidatus Sarmatiella mevalonica]